MRRSVTQQTLCLTDVSLAMAHVTGAKVAVHGLYAGADAVGGEVVAQQGEQDVERGAVTYCYVIDLVPGFWVFSSGSQQVGLHGVGHEAEVTAGFTVAVDIYGVALQQCGCPFGNDGGIGTVGVLARAKYIEVAQAHGVEAVAAGKHLGIQFVDVFGNGVRAKGLADGIFHLGQRGMVAIGGTAGGVGKAFHLGVAGSHQHVQETGDVGAVGGDRVF